LPLRLREAELAIRMSRAASAGSDPTTRTDLIDGGFRVGQDPAHSNGHLGKRGEIDLPSRQLSANARMKSNAVAYCVAGAFEDFCNGALVNSHSRSHGVNCIDMIASLRVGRAARDFSAASPRVAGAVGAP